MIIWKQVILIYTDEGPGGPCGQSMNTTSRWAKAWIFPSDKAARDWLQENRETACGQRKKQRWEICGLEPSHVSQFSNLVRD